MSFPCDVTSEVSVKQTVTNIKNYFQSFIRVFVYNAGQRRFRQQYIEDISIAEFENYFRVNCLGAVLFLQQVLPDLKKRGEGTVLITSATGSVRALAGLSSFSISKFGLRALAQSVARECHPFGVHVVHIIIDGAVDTPLVRGYVEKQAKKKSLQTQTHTQTPPKSSSSFSSSSSSSSSVPTEIFLNPFDVANEYWNLHKQAKSSWTQELDLRPHVEPIFSRM